jgi:hypothetical protein
MTFISSANLTKRVQYRFPKSKRRRVRKKWKNDPKNWRTMPDDKIYIMGNRAICHPLTLRKLNETLSTNNCNNLVRPYGS